MRTEEDEGSHESFFHSYSITVSSEIVYAESPFPFTSEQALTPKPKLKRKFSGVFLPLERVKPAHKPSMCLNFLSL